MVGLGGLELLQMLGLSCALTAVSDHSGLSANRAGVLNAQSWRLIIVWLANWWGRRSPVLVEARFECWVSGMETPSPHFRDEKSYIGGTAPVPNSTAPLSSVPSACLSVGTKTIAPGLISLCSEGTSPTIGIFAGMVIFFSPPL